MDIGNVWDSVGGVIGGLGFSYLSGVLSNVVRIDYPMVCNFAVEIDGIVDTGFVTCQGLHDRITQYEVKQVNKTVSDKIDINQRQVGLVTLEQGFSYQGNLEEWYYDIAEYSKGQKSPRKNVSIIQLQRLSDKVPLLGGQLIEVRRHNLWDCSLVDLTFPQFDADSEDGISILKCVVSCESYDRPTTFGQLGMVLDMLKG